METLSLLPWTIFHQLKFKKLIQEIKNIKVRVTFLLTKHEHLRDDDNKLIASMYFNMAKLRIKDNNYSAMDFLGDFAKGLFPSPESIRRCRQKIQEQNPQLRGESYKERHDKGEDFRIQIQSI